MRYTHESQVSEKTVPFHRFQIQPDEGSNCIMIGRRALVRTDSSIKSSSSLVVEAFSMMASGVVKTNRLVIEGEDRNGG